MDGTISPELEQRVGRFHLRQRLGMEASHEARMTRRGFDFFHVESWYSIHSVVRNSLRLSGLYWRAQNNAARIVIRHNDLRSPMLPSRFDGFTILHISDLHVDISERAMRRLAALVPDLEYDLCVITGDFRGRTFGPIQPTLDGLATIRRDLRSPIYAVLGNHDTIRLVAGLEAMGIHVLLNECATITHGEQAFYLAGVDDPHFFRLDNIGKAAADIPEDAFSILLAHTPEIYRHAAHAGFNVMLCGHTHGGQLCLPGPIAIKTESRLPRSLISGSWRYHAMQGYTSVGAGSSMVPVRLNCPPEITLHRLMCE